MFTHYIDFFSNRLMVVVHYGVIVETEDDSICPCCNEPIAGYWLMNGWKAMCPSADCEGGDWPVVPLTNRYG